MSCAGGARRSLSQDPGLARLFKLRPPSLKTVVQASKKPMLYSLAAMMLLEGLVHSQQGPWQNWRHLRMWMYSRCALRHHGLTQYGSATHITGCFVLLPLSLCASTHPLLPEQGYSHCRICTTHVSADGILQCPQMMQNAGCDFIKIRCMH